MEKKQFKVLIDASPEAVWKTLWDDQSYRQWTSVFYEGTHAVTDWKEGSKVLFLSPQGEGMVAYIEKKDPNRFMSFRHVGTVKNGVEDLDSEETKKWAGAHENYTLNKVGDKTELVVDMDVSDEFLSYFEETFPKALQKVKELSELVHA